MPHYADGSEAHVGDQVIAPVFNSGGPKGGTIVSITPGVESCNAMVQFTEVTEIDAPRPRMAVSARPELVKCEAHGSGGRLVALWTCADYCDTNKLTCIASRAVIDGKLTPAPTS
jgi:hypothetical protein